MKRKQPPQAPIPAPHHRLNPRHRNSHGQFTSPPAGAEDTGFATEPNHLDIDDPQLPATGRFPGGFDEECE